MIPKGSALQRRVAFRMDLLPDWLEATAKEHAESYSTPTELWVVAFLCGISAAAVKKARLTTGNYVNYPQLWVMPIGAPGSGKSDPFSVALKPVQKINEQEYVKYQQEKQKWEAENKQGKKPVWKQLIISDTTTEALFSALSHSNGLTLYMDEMSGWLKNMGRYNKGSDEPYYLMTFNNLTITINRKTDEPQLIRDPFLNIFGTIQPGVLHAYLSQNSAEESGFAQRFLYLYPDFSPKRYNSANKKPSTAAYEEVIRGIVQYGGIADYSLSDAAEKEYERFYNESEGKKYSGSSDFFAGVYSKAQIQLLRMALTIAVARIGKDMQYNELFDEPTEYLVSGEDMAVAVGIINYCIASLIKFKGTLSDKKEQPTKSMLIKYLKTVNPGVSQREIAAAVGVSQPFVQKVLSYQLSPTQNRPQAPILEKIQ